MPIPGGLDSLQSPILVNRGWVPRSWRDKPQNLLRLTSLQMSQQKLNQSRMNKVPGGENPSIFVPANDPSTGRWFYVDVPAMARAIGLPEDTIYVEDVHEDIDRSRPYPVPRDINTLIRSKVMPQDHLNYTVTWYSLSSAVTFMAYKRLKPSLPADKLSLFKSNLILLSRVC
ncbi:hypothetical protein Bca52824_020805 [Brassica carinata]|uniref:SURF1-like protein n=1 Tax=Brassica carinata TaxID=52824 RepID=A0A8X7VVN1_BRACI|nr:hypothetical protein Bca52824_020805 [Brassica carinata]